MDTLINENNTTKTQDGLILKLNSQVNKGKIQLSQCNQVISEKTKEIENLQQIIHSLKHNVKNTDGEMNLLRFQLSKFK